MGIKLEKVLISLARRHKKFYKNLFTLQSIQLINSEGWEPVKSGLIYYGTQAKIEKKKVQKEDAREKINERRKFEDVFFVQKNVQQPHDMYAFAK